MLRIGRQRFLEIREMLSVVNAAVADNVDGENAVGEIGHDSFDDGDLVDGGAHWDRVVSWHEDEIGEGGGADEFALYIVVKRHVTLGKMPHVSPSNPQIWGSFPWKKFTIEMVMTLGLGM